MHAEEEEEGKVQPNIAHVLFCMCWAINFSLVFFFIPRSKVYLYPGGVGGRVSSIWGSTLQSVSLHASNHLDGSRLVQVQGAHETPHRICIEEITVSEDEGGRKEGTADTP